jgi:hypothetical protein
MKLSRFKYYTTLLSILVITGFVYGQNSGDALRLSEPGLGFNARAMGMGNAYSALSDDFSAVYFNPAGLGLVKRLEFAGGINYSTFNNDVTFFGNKLGSSNSETKLDQLSFVFPFPTLRGSFVLALGYNRDKNFNGINTFKGFNSGSNSMTQALLGKGDVSYLLYLTDATGVVTPINGQLSQEGTITSSGGIGKWSFSAASEIARKFYIGGTLNIYSGDYKRSRDYYEDDTENHYGGNILTDPGTPNTADFQTFHLNDVIDWDIAGWDAKVGFIYQAYSSILLGVRVGGSIKFPTSYTIKEDYTVSGESFFANASYTVDPPLESKLEYEITTPFVFTGGISVNYSGLILNTDLTYIDYTQMEFTSGLTPSEMSQNNNDIKDQFRGVMNFNVGAEYTIPETGLRLRGGFILNPSPYDGDPSEFDKKYLTGGIGFLTDETIALDLAYVHGWWEDIGDNYGTNVSRTFQDVTYGNVVFTFSYRF